MALDPSEQSNQLFDFETENKYLKITISALRTKMEKLQINHEGKINN